MTRNRLPVGASGLALVALLLLTLPARPAQAGILGLSEQAIDFTKPADVGDRARWFDDDLWGCTDEGFGKKPGAKGGRRTTIRILEPLALGVWWRPTDNARVAATLAFGGKDAPAVQATLFVRHACDAHHWSKWQHVTDKRPQAKDPSRRFETTLRVTRELRRIYHAGLRWYAEQDVPWTSNEEAFAQWWKERHPDAFTTSRPFLGYLQFMIELDLPPGVRLRTFEAEVTWAVSGVSAIPEDPAAKAEIERRIDEPWSWKAEGDAAAQAAAKERAADEKAVQEAVLRTWIEDEAKKRNENPQRVTVHPRTTGTSDLFTLPWARRRSFWSVFQGVDRALAEDFRNRNEHGSWVAHDLDVGIEVVFATLARHRSHYVDGIWDWGQHVSEWPGSFGRITFSGVGFDPTRTQALLYVSRNVGYLASRGVLFRLEKKDERWQVVARHVIWMS